MNCKDKLVLKLKNAKFQYIYINIKKSEMIYSYYENLKNLICQKIVNWLKFTEPINIKINWNKNKIEKSIALV